MIPYSGTSDNKGSLQEKSLIFPKMYSFPFVAYSSDCIQEFAYFPHIYRYISTLFPNTESYVLSSLELLYTEAMF